MGPGQSSRLGAGMPRHLEDQRDVVSRLARGITRAPI